MSIHWLIAVIQILSTHIPLTPNSCLRPPTGHRDPSLLRSKWTGPIRVQKRLRPLRVDLLAVLQRGFAVSGRQLEHADRAHLQAGGTEHG